MNLNPNTCQPQRVVLPKPRSSLNPALACSTSESKPPLEPSPQMFQWLSRTSDAVCWLSDDSRGVAVGYMQAGIQHQPQALSHPNFAATVRLGDDS